MEIRITSVVCEKFSEKFRSLTVELEDLTSQVFESLKFGADITQFVIVFIAVGTHQDNKTFFNEHDKVGVYKDFISKQKIKFISLAISLDTADIEQGQIDICHEVLINLIDEKFKSHSLKIPQEFRFQGFKNELLKTLKK